MKKATINAFKYLTQTLETVGEVAEKRNVKFYISNNSITFSYKNKDLKIQEGSLYRVNIEDNSLVIYDMKSKRTKHIKHQETFKKILEESLDTLIDKTNKKEQGTELQRTLKEIAKRVPNKEVMVFQNFLEVTIKPMEVYVSVTEDLIPTMKIQSSDVKAVNEAIKTSQELAKIINSI